MLGRGSEVSPQGFFPQIFGDFPADGADFFPQIFGDFPADFRRFFSRRWRRFFSRRFSRIFPQISADFSRRVDKQPHQICENLRYLREKSAKICA
jgi:hypothetical protein